MARFKKAKLKVDRVQRRNLLNMNGKRLVVGVEGRANAQKAGDLEFGDSDNNQVARPIFRLSFEHEDMQQEYRKAMVKVLMQKSTLRDVVMKMSDKLRIMIRDQVVENQLIPLKSESTVGYRSTVEFKQDRGSLSPDSIGIDTADMVMSITGKVKRR